MTMTLINKSKCYEVDTFIFKCYVNVLHRLSEHNYRRSYECLPDHFQGSRRKRYRNCKLWKTEPATPFPHHPVITSQCKDGTHPKGMTCRNT